MFHVMRKCLHIGMWKTIARRAKIPFQPGLQIANSQVPGPDSPAVFGLSQL